MGDDHLEHERMALEVCINGTARLVIQKTQVKASDLPDVQPGQEGVSVVARMSEQCRTGDGLKPRFFSQMIEQLQSSMLA
jgi:hypothetical protein